MKTARGSFSMPLNSLLFLMFHGACQKLAAACRLPPAACRLPPRVKCPCGPSCPLLDPPDNLFTPPFADARSANSGGLRPCKPSPGCKLNASELCVEHKSPVCALLLHPDAPPLAVRLGGQMLNRFRLRRAVSPRGHGGQEGRVRFRPEAASPASARPPAWPKPAIWPPLYLCCPFHRHV